MGQCQECGADVDEKYKFCMPCVKKMREANKEVGAVKSAGSEEVVRALGAINNNLYALRTIAEARLEKECKLVLRWDKKEARFLIEKKWKAKV